MLLLLAPFIIIKDPNTTLEPSALFQFEAKMLLIESLFPLKE